jgi:hypothetical protein
MAGGEGSPAGAPPELNAALQAFRRQALHAARLELAHPLTAGRWTFEAPLPHADMRALLAALRAPPRILKRSGAHERAAMAGDRAGRAPATVRAAFTLRSGGVSRGALGQPEPR